MAQYEFPNLELPFLFPNSYRLREVSPFFAFLPLFRNSARLKSKGEIWSKFLSPLFSLYQTSHQGCQFEPSKQQSFSSFWGGGHLLVNDVAGPPLPQKATQNMLQASINLLSLIIISSMHERINSRPSGPIFYKDSFDQHKCQFPSALTPRNLSK